METANLKDRLKDGDIVTIHECIFDRTHRIGDPYQAIVLMHRMNEQPLITPINEYKPRFMTYEDIIKINGHIDLDNILASFRSSPDNIDTNTDTKKARLILAVTEQVSEYDYERHMKTVEVDVPKSDKFDITKADILGGEWVKK